MEEMYLTSICVTHTHAHTHTHTHTIREVVLHGTMRLCADASYARESALVRFTTAFLGHSNECFFTSV